MSSARGVEFHPDAEAELAAAAAFYAREAPRLGEELVAAVEDVVARIVQFPASGAPYAGSTRRLLVSRFPFAVIYRERAARSVEIVAVMHLRRRPGYWCGRL